MYLSMHVIADWLKQYHPECRIHDGSMCLRNVRLLSDSNAFSSSIVYVGAVQEFIPTLTEGVVCANRDDMIIVTEGTINEVFNKVMDAFDHYNDWDNTLNQKIMSGCTIQDLVDCSEELFRNPINVFNANHLLMGISSDRYLNGAASSRYFYQALEHKFQPLDITMEFNRILKNTAELKEPFIFNFHDGEIYSLMQNIFYSGAHIGWVGIYLTNQPYSKSMEQLCNEFVQKLAMWKTVNHELDSFSSQSELYLKILNGRIEDSTEIWNQLHSLNWFEEDEKYLIQLEIPQDASFLYQQLVYQYTKAFSGCYIFPYEASLILVNNSRIFPVEKLLEEIKPMLKKCRSYYGVSYPFKDILDMKQAQYQANIALIYGRRNEKLESRCENFAVSYAIQVLKEHLMTDITHPILKKIQKYDDIHGTEYEATLKAYLQNERNQIRTAEELHIHKNTLLYRLDRLTNAFGLNLDQYETREHLRLSFLLDTARYS